MQCAGEETIIARVGEGMVSTIGSANTHKDVLENPDHISKNILSRGLDAGTAYGILSNDIADVDVGENIGAKLQIDQANADKQIAQAKAEERRAMAVAHEQEMRARIVEAEAEVPRDPRRDDELRAPGRIGESPRCAWRYSGPAGHSNHATPRRSRRGGTFMQVQTNTDRSVAGSAALSAQVEESVTDLPGRFSQQVTRVEVHHSDENGQRGGSGDKRCSAAKLARAVESTLERLRSS